MKRIYIYLGIFLIALTTLIWEILLTRIFSATMYYHFVFMSISLAMLGFGCSGIIVFLFPGFFTKEKSNHQLTFFSLLLSASIIIAIVNYLQIKVQINPSLFSFLILLKIFFFIFLPYFFSGIIITLLLKHYPQKVTTLYFCDLTGAGLGCILVIFLLFIFDGISLVLLTSFLTALASLVFAQNSSIRIFKIASFLMTLLSFFTFITNAYIYRFLKINYVQGIPQKGIIFEKWNPINRVTVIPEKYLGNKALRINYDAAALAHMNFFDGDISKVSYLQNYIVSFYYQIRKNAEVLVIGVGGSQDVLAAYINGHRRIDGVEINPTIAQLNTDLYRNFNGNLFAKPGIKMFVDDGRNFVRHTEKKYDIIHLSNVDSGVASSSGAFTFVENTLYTVEAFKDYYNHLKEDGVLWIGRWRFNNDLENLRLLTTAIQALYELGIRNVEQHLVILGEKPRLKWSQALFLMKKTPFLHQEIKAIEGLRIKMDLEWLHHPEKRMDNHFDDYLFTVNKSAFLKKYPLRIDPSTDNCPFFFNFLKPAHYLWKLPKLKTHFTYPVFMFKTLFIIVFIMVFVAIILPLIIFKCNSSSLRNPVKFWWGYLFYFICLGLGFMMVEIPLIQKFILFLGQPLYAIAVILSALLISSGTGSLLAGSLSYKTTLKRLQSFLFILCLLFIIYIFGLPVVFETLLGKSEVLRVFISILLIFPLGILMGMAFPLGISQLEQEDPSMIPWVWGLNGACSVLGSILAWGLSLNYGYNATLWIATIIYCFAFLTMMFKLTLKRKYSD